MNQILLVLSLLSLNIFSQKILYTTDGLNRISIEELNILKKQTSKKYEKLFSKPMYVEIEELNSSKSENLILKKIKFNISDKSIEQQIQREPFLAFKGKKIPSFNLKTFSNKRISNQDLIGKPTLINFWFIGCKTCVEEMPSLNKIKKLYKDKVNFISITYESKEDLEIFFKNHKYNFIKIIEAKSYIKKIQIKDYPKNIILNKNGTIVKILGGIPYIAIDNEEMKIGEGEEIMAELNKLL